MAFGDGLTEGELCSPIFMLRFADVVVAVLLYHLLEDTMLFLSRDCSSDTRRWYAALSPDTGHDEPFPDFLPCFIPKVLHAVHVL